MPGGDYEGKLIRGHIRVSKFSGGDSRGRRLGMEDRYRSVKSRAEKKVGRKSNKIQRAAVNKAAQETA